MPAGKRPQSNGWLYAAITFIALFIIATTTAVISYVKFEEGRTAVQKAQNDLEDVASDRDMRKGLGKIVGAKQSRESYLGKMVEYLDEMVVLVIGEMAENTSAEEKVKEVNRKIKDTLELIENNYPDIANVEQNLAGLIRTLKKMKQKLDEFAEAKAMDEMQISDLDKRLDNANASWRDTKQNLLAEKENLEQQVADIKQDYQELRTLLEQTTDLRVQTLSSRLKEERTSNEELKKELQKVQAEFNSAEARMKRALKEVQRIKPGPSIDVTAFSTDGKIILIDNQTKIAHINIGSDDRVYPGMTFAVYDKSLPIPRDGISKAEIEVFNVGKNISTARIVKDQINNPIILEDKIANLIWDSSKVNVFAVAGDFDLDGDGIINDNAVDNIKLLIEKWKGVVADNVSIETDFLILGTPPRVRSKPTLEEMEVYPRALERYTALLERLDHYNEIQNNAKALSVPIFKYDVFLYLIGYKNQSGQAGAF